jgi:hypothetical protein
MGAIYSRQPNGKICRFSTVVDCPTDWNMTDEEFIEWYAGQARDEARFILQYKLRPFGRVIDDFAPRNMSVEEFKEVLKSMGHSGEIVEKEWWSEL